MKNNKIVIGSDHAGYSLKIKIVDYLKAKGIEVIYDDRSVSAGIMFADADLLGVPVRAIVSPRNLKQNIVEVKTRDKSFAENISMDEAVEAIVKLVADKKAAERAVADKI